LGIFKKLRIINLKSPHQKKKNNERERKKKKGRMDFIYCGKVHTNMLKVLTLFSIRKIIFLVN
jgi:hypothetical protein